MIPYEDFLRAKVKLAESWGYDVAESEINPALKPHQRAMVKWGVAGGRRACFAAFGLGKSVVQLETVRITLTRCHGRGLIVCPLGVRQEFIRDARQESKLLHAAHVAWNALALLELEICGEGRTGR